MTNSDYYTGELLRLQRQAASAQRMGDSASPDPRDAYKRHISSDWLRPFDLNDSAASSDSMSFTDSAPDVADAEITFADAVAYMHKAKVAATKDATDSVEPRTTYTQRLSDSWRAA